MKSIILAPLHICRAVHENRGLLLQLTRRDIQGRYRGSYLGLLWSFVTPLLMLAVYTFVFSVILKVSWSGSSGSTVEFALILFAGLIVFNLFSEVANGAPMIILARPNYVKKVVFPLEILPVAVMGGALFHALASFIILVTGVAVFYRTLSWTLVLLPLVCVPLSMLTLGVAWFLAAFGVFVRDVKHAITVVTMILFFVTPILYPIERVPESMRSLAKANPLAVLVDSCRRVVMWQQMPDWPWFIVTTVMSFLCLCIGFAFFERTRRSFADVM